MNFNKNVYGLFLYSALLLFAIFSNAYPEQQGASLTDTTTSMPLAVAISAQLSPHTQQLQLIKQVIAYAQLQNLPTPELTLLYEQLKNNQPITQATAYPALQKISAILPAIYRIPYQPYHEFLHNPAPETTTETTRAPRPTPTSITGATSSNPPISQLVAAAISAALNSIKTSTNPFSTHDLVVTGTLNAQGKVTFNKDGNTYNFPTTRGSASQVLKLSDNSGTLTWQYAAGDVTGPANATSNAIPRFNGTSGKVIKNSSATIDDTGKITTPDGTVTTSATTLTSHGLLVGAGANAVTALDAATNGQIPIGSTGADPVPGNITSTNNSLAVNNSAGTLVVTNGAGTISIDTPAVLRTDTGWGEWGDEQDSGHPYFNDETLGQFTLTRGGSGYIKGVYVSWAGPQTITGMTPGNAYWIYIDTEGHIGKSATYSAALFTDHIVLFTCLYPTTPEAYAQQVTVKENHPYHHPMHVSLFEHDAIGCIIENENRGANIALCPGYPQKITIDGDDTLLDHGLETQILGQHGASIFGIAYFTDEYGKWSADTLGFSDIFGPFYNNNGTLTDLSYGYYGINTIYASKDNLNTSEPTYFAVIDNAQYPTLDAAMTAISDDTRARATNELAALELCRLGFVVYGQAEDQIVQVIVDKETLKPSLSANGLNQASLVNTITGSFNNILTTDNTNVQSALNKIDAWGEGTATQHGVLLGQGVGQPTAAVVGQTNTVLTGMGYDTNPAFLDTPILTSIETTGGATLAGTVSIQGTTNINTEHSGDTTIGHGTDDTVTLHGATNVVNGPLHVTGQTTLDYLDGFLKATVGAVSAQNTIETDDTDATSYNTADKLVKRDGSGDFAASTITAQTVTGLNPPTDLTDAANKQYVDTNSGGLNVKPAVRLVSIDNVNYIHDPAGPGAIYIDSVQVEDDDRVLLTNQDDPIDNGIWVASTSTYWSRPADFEAPQSAIRAYCLITDGTVYANTSWYCTTPEPATIDTYPLTFVQFSADTHYSIKNVGNGAEVAKLPTVGTTFSLRSLNSANANLTITQNTDDITFLAKKDPELTGLTVHGLTAINANSDTSNTIIGHLTYNKVGIGGDVSSTSAMLKVTGSTEVTNDLTANHLIISNNGATITGTTNINTDSTGLITTIGNAVNTTRITGPTYINNGASTSNTQIGNSSNYVGIGGTPDTSYRCTINGTSKLSDRLTVSSGGAAITGPTDITGATTVTGTTNINTTGTGVTTAIGNANNTTTIVGTANINRSGAGITTIGNATSTNTIAGTTGFSGATNINTSGTAATQIGNASSVTGIGGASDASYALKVTGNFLVTGTPSGQFVPAGTVTMFAGSTAPAGYLLCDGTGYPTTGIYANLFAVIDYTYGGSPGTFNVPDMRAFLPVGYKLGDPLFGALNNTGGAREFTLTTTQLPSHTHTATDAGHTHPINVINTNKDGDLKIRTSNSSAGTATNTSQTGYANITISPTGSGQPFSILPPYRTLNYIIKY